MSFTRRRFIQAAGTAAAAAALPAGARPSRSAWAS